MASGAGWLEWLNVHQPAPNGLCLAVCCLAVESIPPQRLDLLKTSKVPAHPLHCPLQQSLCHSRLYLWALDGARSAPASMSLSPLAGIAPASFMCCLTGSIWCRGAGEEAMLWVVQGEISCSEWGLILPLPSHARWPRQLPKAHAWWVGL